MWSPGYQVILLTILIFINQFVFEITSRLMLGQRIIKSDHDSHYYYRQFIPQFGCMIGLLVLLIPIGSQLLLPLTMFAYCTTILLAPTCETSIWFTLIAFGITRMCYVIWLNSICVWLVQMWKTSFATVLQLLFFTQIVGQFVIAHSNFFTQNDDEPKNVVAIQSIENQFYILGIVQTYASVFACILYFKKFQSKAKALEEEDQLIESHLDQNSQPNQQIPYCTLKIAIFGLCVFAFLSAQYLYYSDPLEIPDKFKQNLTTKNIISWSSILGLLFTAFLTLFFASESILILHFVLTFGSLFALMFPTNFYAILLGTILWSFAFRACWPAALAFVHQHFKLTNRVVAFFALIYWMAPFSDGGLFASFETIRPHYCPLLVKQVTACLVFSCILFVIVKVLVRRKREFATVNAINP